MRSCARRMEVRAASLLSNHCDFADCGVVNVLSLTFGCNNDNGVLGCRLWNRKNGVCPVVEDV
jgi:hypothetical protein